jgi:nickel transport protein
MNRTHRNSMPLAIALAAVFSMPAYAHDAWSEARGASYAVVFGHDGKLEDYAPTKVKEIVAVDANGALLKVTQTATANGVTFALAGKPALVTLNYDNGFWSKTTAGLKNLPKNQVPGAIGASHAVKFGKTVYAWGPAVMNARGQDLEIVPVSSNAPVAGKPLAVQVMWQGKPLAGAKIARVEGGPETSALTDASGKATLAVVRGKQVLSVSHKQDLPNDPRADLLTMSANLAFEAR